MANKRDMLKRITDLIKTHKANIAKLKSKIKDAEYNVGLISEQMSDFHFKIRRLQELSRKVMQARRANDVQDEVEQALHETCSGAI